MNPSCFCSTLFLREDLLLDQWTKVRTFLQIHFTTLLPNTPSSRPNGYPMAAPNVSMASASS